MTMSSAGGFDLGVLMRRLVELWSPHHDILATQVTGMTFTVRTDGSNLYCAHCTNEPASDSSISLEVMQNLRWGSECTHVPNLTSVISCIDDSDLAETLIDVLAIRQPREYDFTLGAELSSNPKAALTIGMAYSAFQQFVDARLWQFENREQSTHADVIRVELDEARRFLEEVHSTTIGNDRIRRSLRKEANKMVEVSSESGLGWIALGYLNVSIADNDLLRPQTIARALQASYAPTSLHEDDIVLVPFWVADALSKMAPGIVKSQFHVGVAPEVIDAAVTLWREADGGIFADFDASVSAARKLS